MEDAGRQLSPRERTDPAVQTAVTEAVDAIFAAGVEHGDLEWRHIRVKEGGASIMVIDFDKSGVLDENHASDSKTEYRDEILAELFASAPP
ncbi:uncharacterized protein EHS24_003816 [Apiotrichum porosum]|nr:uncharacterized protein EHS24_003816 [Apiotrichum porosum]RSH76883.1 hypothetical protein EHS24_003816 [Apiotrichum porosum]